MSSKTNKEFANKAGTAKISLTPEEYEGLFADGGVLVYQFVTRTGEGGYTYVTPYPQASPGEERAGIQFYDPESYARMRDGGFKALGVEHEVLHESKGASKAQAPAERQIGGGPQPQQQAEAKEAELKAAQREAEAAKAAAEKAETDVSALKAAAEGKDKELAELKKQLAEAQKKAAAAPPPGAQS